MSDGARGQRSKRIGGPTGLGWRATRALAAGIGTVAALAAAPAAAGGVFIDEMTTNEVGTALREGSSTVLIPIGGTEQNGPHMVLGKHNARATLLAGRVAQQLGDALVAPTVNYVPEGAVHPPTGHMRFAGTISVPDEVFTGVLQAAARSLRQHGFRHIVLLGDSGNYQALLQQAAARLNQEWAGQPGRVHYIAAYYQAASTGFASSLRARGLSEAQIGSHAGSADTSLSLALDARLVRSDKLQDAARAGAAGGTLGDPRSASAELGRAGVDTIVAETVRAIREQRHDLR
jgi:creatinine amidohydrolase